MALQHPRSMDHLCSPSKRVHLWAWRPAYRPLLSILLACGMIELILQGADHGLWGGARWRGIAYEYGGFWRGLLGTWEPNYAAQPVAMFATYGFLHGGVIHLLVNMLTLLSLGRLITDQVGPLRFIAIYILSLLGGAAGFALLSTAVQPMVGASGALFGLAGAVMGSEYATRRIAQEKLTPLAGIIGVLIALNGVMYWLMDGNLAWETHLGGLLTGGILGLWMHERVK